MKQVTSYKYQVASNKYQVASKNNLPKRFISFGKEIIAAVKLLKADYISRPIITQLVRSSTSIGANYAEAQNASSRKDFRNKIYIAKKEAQETKHWLYMLESCYPDHSDNIKRLGKECLEIILILQTIAAKLESAEL